MMWEGITKKLGQKNKKKIKNSSPSVRSRHSGKRPLPRVPNCDTQESLKKRKNVTACEDWPSCTIFFPECLSSPSATLCRSSPSAYKSGALGETSLPRVHFFPECNTRKRASSPSAHFFSTRESHRYLGNFSSAVVNTAKFYRQPVSS
jgi:hypothetical protein